MSEKGQKCQNSGQKSSNNALNTNIIQTAFGRQVPINESVCHTKQLRLLLYFVPLCRLSFLLRSTSAAGKVRFCKTLPNSLKLSISSNQIFQ